MVGVSVEETVSHLLVDVLSSSSALRQAGLPLDFCKRMGQGMPLVLTSLLSEKGSKVHAFLLRERAPTAVAAVFEGRREPAALSASVCRCFTKDLVCMSAFHSCNSLWSRYYYLQFSIREADAQWGSVIYICSVLNVEYESNYPC